jgi:hypothetical protein
VDETVESEADRTSGGKKKRPGFSPDRQIPH